MAPAVAVNPGCCVLRPSCGVSRFQGCNVTCSAALPRSVSESLRRPNLIPALIGRFLKHAFSRQLADTVGREQQEPGHVRRIDRLFRNHRPKCHGNGIISPQFLAKLGCCLRPLSFFELKEPKPGGSKKLDGGALGCALALRLARRLERISK